MRALSQKVHTRPCRRHQSGGAENPSSHGAAPENRGRVVSGVLPADALAELHGLTLLLAPVERRLERGGEDHEEREEDHDAEREVGDDLVVRLPVEALAVVAGEGGGGWYQPGREHEDGSQLPHSGGTIPCPAR